MSFRNHGDQHNNDDAGTNISPVTMSSEGHGEQHDNDDTGSVISLDTMYLYDNPAFLRNGFSPTSNYATLPADENVYPEENGVSTHRATQAPSPRPQNSPEEQSQYPSSFETTKEPTWASYTQVQPYPPTQSRRQSLGHPVEVPGLRDDFSADTISKKMWTAFWIRPTVLWVLAVTYLVCVAALVILRHYSLVGNGFFISEATSHYLWTYGPTFFIVLVASLWRQVDMHCRTVAPWVELQRGDNVAPGVLQDDYISPMPHSIVYIAIKKRRWPIVISTIGQVLFKVLIALSSGLLVLQASFNQQKEVPLATRSFDNKLLNESIPIHDKDGLKNGTFPNAHLYTLYANWTELDHTDLPYGFTNNLAFAPLPNPNSTVPESSITGTVAAIVPSMRCQPMDVEIPTTINSDTWYLTRRSEPLPGPAKRDDSPHYLKYTVEYSIKNGFCDSWPSIQVAVPDILDDQLPSRKIHSWRTHFHCGSESTNTTVKTWSPKAWPPGNGYRGAEGSPNSYENNVPNNYTPSGFLFFVADYRQKGLAGVTQTNLNVSSDLNSDARLIIPSIQAISCIPSYGTAKLNVTAKFQQSATVPQEILLSDPFDLEQPIDEPSLSSTDLIRAIESAFEDNVYLFQDDVDSVYVANDTFVGFMGLTEGASGSLEPLLDQDRFINASGRAFQALMAGTAWEVLLSDSSDTFTTGELRWPVDRLAVNEPIVWTMVGLFTTLGIFGAILALISTPHLLTAEPGSIGSLVAMLAHLPILRKMVGDPQLQPVENNLPAGSVELKGPESGKPGWWRPLALKTWYLCLSILLAVILIIVLEILQHVSDSNSGFSTVSNQMDAQVLIRIVPAALALLVATLIGSIDANILIFAPFSALRQRIRSSEVLSNNLLLKPTPVALYYSIKLKYWGALFTALAVLVGALLSVAASGLYVLDVVPHETPISVFQQDFYNMTSVTDGQSEAAASLSLIERQNQSYPQNSYDGVALPSLHLDTQGQNFSGPVTITVPVLRAALDCTPIPADKFDVITIGFDFVNNSTGSGAYATMSSNQTSSCGNGSRLYSDGWSIGQKELNDLSDGTYGMYWGQIFSKDNSCSSFTFIFGYAAWPCADISQNRSCIHRGNMTIMECSQQIQEVSAQVTYTDATLATVDTTRPPVVNESSAVLIQNENGTSFPYSMQENLDGTFQVWDTINTSGSMGEISWQPFDAFFQIATKGAGAVAPARLLASEDEMMARVLQVYRRYMGLAMGGRGRQACGGTDADPAACRAARTGTAVVSAVRVRQDRGAKVALQVLLALMASLSLAGVLLTRTRDVLRRNPCSLAGSMSLLADSRMVETCGELSRGLGETATKDGMRGAMVRLGDGFMLRWWPGSEAGEQIYGIDTVKDGPHKGS